MKPLLSALAGALLLALAVVPSQAQRKPAGNSPFSDFHKNESIATGKPAPRLFAQDTDGKDVDLRDYLGQWVFIEFGSYT